MKFNLKKRKIMKKFINSEKFRLFLSWIISVYIKICFHTSKWIVKDGSNVETLVSQKKSFIVCFWHGRLLMMPFCWHFKKKFFMLISAHRDGKLISEAVKYFGIETITGSSSNTKISSVKNIIQKLKNNQIVGVTPDGPRGPNQKVKEGLISLAKKTSTPIITLSLAAKYKKSLNSWDKFKFVYPFNKIVVVWGNPIYFKKEDLVENKKTQLEQELKRITNLADNLSS
tara:strand:- start:2268 stop:2951 length:684 start_codon:yes stop_codon:yes gene_type:complete